MSRPITQTYYLLAKAATLAPLVAMVTILPLLLTALVAALLSRVSWAIAVEAMGISLVIGGLLTLFYTAVTLFLSSLTRRKGIAAAGVFAVNFGLTVPAGILATRIGNPAILYLSPWDDYVAVASAAFGATPSAIDWLAARAVLLGVTVAAAFGTYIWLRVVEGITGGVVSSRAPPSPRGMARGSGSKAPPRPSAREPPASAGRTERARARCSSSSSGNSTGTKARSRCSARTRGTTSP